MGQVEVIIPGRLLIPLDKKYGVDARKGVKKSEWMDGWKEGKQRRTEGRTNHR